MRKIFGHSCPSTLLCIVVCACLAVNSSLCAQDLATAQARPDPAFNSLPNAPGFSRGASEPLQASSTSATPQNPSPRKPAPNQPTQPGAEDQQKRILEVIPNFRAVSAGSHLPPQTVKDKFVTSTEDSFDYSAFLLAGLVAVYSYGTAATPEFGPGIVGYGRYYWHSFLDQTSENYLVEFILPVLTHEDNRYYTLGQGAFFKRFGYALTRAVVTRTDSGGEAFNISEVFGAGLAAGISNLYYPSPERTVGNTMEKWGDSVAIDAMSFVVKEFAPDIHHKLFAKKEDRRGSSGPMKLRDFRLNPSASLP